jgi:hypothetical protein
MDVVTKGATTGDEPMGRNPETGEAIVSNALKRVKLI